MTGSLRSRPLNQPTPAGPRTLRNLNLNIAARRGRIYSCHNLHGMQSNEWPLRSTQHHKRDSAPTEILLVLNVLVSGKKHVEPGPLRFGQQVAVGKRVPPPLFRPGDGVSQKEPGNTPRCSMIKKNEHQRTSLWHGHQPEPHQDCGRQIPAPR